MIVWLTYRKRILNYVAKLAAMRACVAYFLGQALDISVDTRTQCVSTGV